LEKRIPEMAQIETLQTGRTIREMKAQLGRLPEWLRVFRYRFTPVPVEENALISAIIMQPSFEQTKRL
jgi:hypothetical protein